MAMAIAVRTRLFSRLREQAGTDAGPLEGLPGSTLDDLYDTPQMATAEMRKIAAEIGERWPEARVAMAHRTGRLEIGEASVVVSVSCPHRAEAIDACRWGIDRLKESVPIWKKEHAADGTYWIEGDEALKGT